MTKLTDFKIYGIPSGTELSKDKEYAIYELSFVQEIMHYLNELGTDKSKELLQRMICPVPREDMSEEELYLCSITSAERKAMLYGASLPKDSEALKILRKLEPSVKSESLTYMDSHILSE